MFSTMTAEERQTFPGLYVGHVEEVNELGLGRIKVTFPAIPDIEAWARPCFPYGHFFVPQKEDKVWIAFEGGDPHFPVWLGVWYPEDTVPPPADETHDSEPVQRVISTASGHFLLFDDTSDAATITLNHSGGEQAAATITLTNKTMELRLDPHTIILDNDDDAEGKTIEITHSDNKGKVVLSKDDIIINFGDNATVTLADSSITLTAGDSSITLNGEGINLTYPDSTISLNGNVTLEGTEIHLN